jgi:hypothetical protein
MTEQRVAEMGEVAKGAEVPDEVIRATIEQEVCEYYENIVEKGRKQTNTAMWLAGILVEKMESLVEEEGLSSDAQHSMFEALELARAIDGILWAAVDDLSPWRFRPLREATS